jgi:hypothetical protein
MGMVNNIFNISNLVHSTRERQLKITKHPSGCVVLSTKYKQNLPIRALGIRFKTRQ